VRHQESASKQRKSQWVVALEVESRKLRISTSRLRAITVRALELVQHEVRIPGITHLSMLIIGDDRMREINREYRGKDKPTDVLSFPQFEPAEIQGRRKVPTGSGEFLGDLVISTDTTLRQAAKFEVSVEDEFVRLVVHGLLHLCGYDHEGVSRNEAERMRRRERRIRKALLADPALTQGSAGRIRR
jgi:probable rRNA maturation factor